MTHLIRVGHNTPPLMEAGQVVEAGPPEELLRRGGRFAALWELEAAGWDWQRGDQALS